MKRDDLNAMMRQVQQMQAEMVEAQESLADETVEGSAGGGMVRAVMTGNGELREVVIDPKVVDADEVEMLQDLVVAAIADANRRAQSLQGERLGSVGGLGDLLGGPAGPGASPA